MKEIDVHIRPLVENTQRTLRLYKHAGACHAAPCDVTASGPQDIGQDGDYAGVNGCVAEHTGNEQCGEIDAPRRPVTFFGRTGVSGKEGS